MADAPANGSLPFALCPTPNGSDSEGIPNGNPASFYRHRLSTQTKKPGACAPGFCTAVGSPLDAVLLN